MRTSVDTAIAAFEPTLPLLVAYSGGADSTALLAACAARWPGQVRALHVHHGLQSAADDFVRHCESFCLRINVPLTVCRVQASHAPGESPEDAARKARRAAFVAAAKGALHEGIDATGDSKTETGLCMDPVSPTRLLQSSEPGEKPNAEAIGALSAIALAHHADDQAETLLLALSRGAGLPGMSAMPARWVREGVVFHRPLLAVQAADIRQWLAERDMPHVVDPTNGDERYTRNRIRARLLPALDAAFPQFRETFARSIAHAAQAQHLLDELAASDLAAVGLPPAIRRLQALSTPRQANVLRHWLKTVHAAMPSAAQLNELLAQVGDCRTRGHRIRLKVGQGFVVREEGLDRGVRGGVLGWYNPGALPPGA